MRLIIFICLLVTVLTTGVSSQKRQKKILGKQPETPYQNLPADVTPPPAKEITGEAISGKIFRYENFPTKISLSRNVDVWLPPDYDKNANARYPVLYMHDGQNIFNPADSQSGVEWRVDETLTGLIKEKKARPAIIVGIWHTPYRFPEYAPQKALELNIRKDIKNSPLITQKEGESDKYLRFIVSELKPFIDKNYRTKTDLKNTFIMGSSQGGLMSVYAISEYPNVFGGAACLSTQFPLGDGIIVEYMKKFLPAPKNHRIYFDYGTESLDAAYEPFQMKADAVLEAKGYKLNKNWVTKKFAGADHTEKSWSERIDVPLVFLLGK